MAISLADYLLILLVFPASIFVHETGHILAALLVGWKPLSLQVGTGKRFTALKIGIFELQFGSNPWNGLARAYALRFQNFRLAKIIFALGGPIANLAVVAVVVELSSISTLSDFANRWGGFLIWVITVQVILLIYTLIPRMGKIDGRLIPNDALQVWDTLWAKPAELRKEYQTMQFGYAGTLLTNKKIQEAKDVVLEQAQFSEDRAEPFDFELVWIRLLLGYGHMEEARQEWHGFISEHQDPTTRATFLDKLACIPLMDHQPILLPLAMAAIDEAIALSPDAITLKGTKGSLLIEADDLDAGSALLQEVMEQTLSETDKAVCAYYFAWVKFKRGATESAREDLAKAIQQYPDCWVRQKIDAKMSHLPALVGRLPKQDSK